MASETNFIDLYRLLNLEPGCDLVEFKRAYRRKVAVLHPDRMRESDDDSARNDSTRDEQLQKLTTLYSAAMGFQRRHGRLPGAPVSRQSGTPQNPKITQARALPAQSRISPWQLIGLMIALVAIWFAWYADWASDDPEANSSTSSAASAGARYSSQVVPSFPLTLNIGMNAAAVRSVEGEPMLVHGYRWEYGPSWVRFENGTVVDWYSSPLNPLKTPSSHPQPATN